MDNQPHTDALSSGADRSDESRPAGHEPAGTGPTGTGTTADGTMGSGQAGPGAGQSGDDIDESGADLAYAEMTGVGVSSPGTPMAPGVSGDAPDEEIGGPDAPKGI
ncbi:MAG TPA: hypothetical protein VF576_08490 [Rubricoccaceae bacterium]|jgi:hypothetical protein